MKAYQKVEWAPGCRALKTGGKKEKDKIRVSVSGGEPDQKVKAILK